MPLEAGAKLALLEADRAIAPGVELIRVPGHTANMQCVKLTGGGKTAFFFADLVPTTAHLPLPWIMGFDLYPVTTLENKKKWIPEVIQGRLDRAVLPRYQNAGGVRARAQRRLGSRAGKGGLKMAQAAKRPKKAAARSSKSEKSKG